MRMKRALAAFLAAGLLLAVSPAAAGEEAAAAETPAPVTDIVLKSGSKGEQVLLLQLRLDELGYDAGAADGAYGSGTKAAVQEFQQRNGLQADGKAGPKTLEKLYSDTAVPMPEPQLVNVLEGPLPMLVNRTHPVDERLMPADMVLLTETLDTRLVKIKYPDTRAVREAAEALEALLEAAEADGVTKWQISAAYRSYSYQERTLNSKISSYLNRNSGWSRERARSAALRTVQEPGCSEHQLGLAIDINVPGASSFAGTKQCKWLHANCWDYGFIVRYTKEKKDITGIDPEAWHIRYVGRDHALRIRELGLCLEEYLEGIENGSVELPGAEETDRREEAGDGTEPEEPGELEEIFVDDKV